MRKFIPWNPLWAFLLASVLFWSCGGDKDKKKDNDDSTGDKGSKDSSTPGLFNDGEESYCDELTAIYKGYGDDFGTDTKSHDELCNKLKTQSGKLDSFLEAHGDSIECKTGEKGQETVITGQDVKEQRDFLRSLAATSGCS